MEEYAIGCQGKYRTPIPEERSCPVCGASVEVFTRAGRIAADAVCPRCGRVLFAQQQPVFAPEQPEVPNQ